MRTERIVFMFRGDCGCVQNDRQTEQMPKKAAHKVRFKRGGPLKRPPEDGGLFQYRCSHVNTCAPALATVRPLCAILKPGYGMRRRIHETTSYRDGVGYRTRWLQNQFGKHGEEQAARLVHRRRKRPAPQ